MQAFSFVCTAAKLMFPCLFGDRSFLKKLRFLKSFKGKVLSSCSRKNSEVVVRKQKKRVEERRAYNAV